jgi:hypothetical protein
VRALVLNCTLKASPAASNTEALARVVIEALEGQSVTTELVWVADYDVRPGVSSDEGDSDQRPRLRSKILDADIGFTIPGQAWTYWNMGPGPGASYTETDQGHDWSNSTGKAAAGNLAAVARALQATPIPPPPGS